MKKHKAKLIVISIIALLLVVSIGYFISKFKQNKDIVCANCSSFIHYKLEDYADEHGGYYPQGGKTPLDSLAKCIQYGQDVHLFTSYLRAGRCMDYWEKNKSLNEDVTIYRYNEGLCEADGNGRFYDPDNLILMYYYKESDTYKGKGRFVFGVPAFKRYFLTEEQFQKAQKKTEVFLKKRNERPEEKRRGKCVNY